MKAYCQRPEHIDWNTHDWGTLLGTRLYGILCDHHPNLERLLGKGSECFTEEEWERVLPILSVLDDVMRCNDMSPFDRMHLEDTHDTVSDMIRCWLRAAQRIGIIGDSERLSILMRLHDHLGL